MSNEQVKATILQYIAICILTICNINKLYIVETLLLECNNLLGRIYEDEVLKKSLKVVLILKKTVDFPGFLSGATEWKICLLNYWHFLWVAVQQLSNDHSDRLYLFVSFLLLFFHLNLESCQLKISRFHCTLIVNRDKFTSQSNLT